MRITAFITALFIIVAVLGTGCTEENQLPPGDTGESVLQEAVAGINGELEAVSTSAGESARVLGEAGLTSAAGKEAVRQAMLNHPYTESTLVVTKDGIVAMTVPDNYADAVNSNISSHLETGRAVREQVPLVSEVFPLREGYAGVAQSYPVFGKGGEYLGFVSFAYRPDAFIGRVVAPLTNGTPYDIWVTQTDGMVIYDTTPEEIGKNLFSDPAYQSPGLQEAFSRIVTEPSGSVEYTFWDRNWERNVTKEAIWDTAGIDGAAWRVIVTRNLDAGEQQVAPAGGRPPAADAAEEMKAFVAKAAAYAREHGRTDALTAFNDPDGEFVRDELYIFAYDMNGTVLALPFQQAFIGTDRSGVHDSGGVAYIAGMSRLAAEGGGSIYYLYPNPARGYAEELKLGYVLPVDGTWFVGSGIYIPDVATTFNVSTRETLGQRVKAARDFAQEQGREAACAAFNDLSGDFANGGEYIFAYGNDGTTLALPYQPEYIGKNRFDLEDRYGIRVILLEIAAAERGGGFVYITYYNPDTGLDELKLCYVAPVDDEWFVGSGVYAGA
ncbi:cache domain-containing protein [Methanoculleus sp.]|uniref:cache domain-containing protein n=1 Tax=Methanoculleus sp. TaxID=90427 RepID=UPI0025E1810B|nr:cache domain-containing protein [Methanoculleus sp.]